MTEEMGEIPRKKPIKHWGCEGEHICKDFPYKGEKVNIVRNVPQANIVEEIGRNIPRIYIALDNKQA
jgi:hypothetical protein